MDDASIWLMIIGVSVVSLAPRMLPVALLSRYEFPAVVKEWLSFVAPAVLGGLTALSVLAPGGRLELSVQNQNLWAFLPTVFVAVKFKNLFLTMLVGILTMALLRHYT